MASALYLNRKLTFQLSYDQNPQTKFLGNFPLSTLFDSTTYAKGTGGALALASPTTDYIVPMAQVTTGKILYVEHDQDITIRFDTAGSGDKRVNRAPNGLGQFLATCDFTALFFSNASGNTANIAYCFAGV